MTTRAGRNRRLIGPAPSNAAFRVWGPLAGLLALVGAAVQPAAVLAQTPPAPATASPGPSAAPAAANSALAVNVPVDNPLNVPDLTRVAPPATDSKGLSGTLQLLVLLTVLTLAPAILVMMTCFTRIVVVLALLRQALATQQLPPNQVIVGLALLMTFFVMGPTWQAVHQEALTPYLAGQLDQQTAIQKAADPVRGFMARQIEMAGNEDDVSLFLEYRGHKDVRNWSEVPISALIPAYVISELKTAFVMGFRIYLPFLIIDLVIASVLISMGMLMLPPVLISLPFKLLLFVLVNGWHLVVGTLLTSFG